MTPEQRSECGRKGAKKAQETRRKKREMRETLEILLSMPMKKGRVVDANDVKAFAELKGKNITVDQALMVVTIQSALKGDLKAVEMIRDTIGEKPKDKMEVEAVTPIIITGEDKLED